MTTTLNQEMPISSNRWDSQRRRSYMGRRCWLRRSVEEMKVGLHIYHVSVIILSPQTQLHVVIQVHILLKKEDLISELT